MSLSKYKKSMLMAGILTLVIGAGLLGFGIYRIKSTSERLRHYVRTSATVVDYERKRNSNYNYDDYNSNEYLYAEIVEYTVDGKTYRVTNSASSTDPKSIGSKMKIAYDPNFPEECIFISDNRLLTVILFIMGGGFILASIFSFVSSFRR